MLLTSFVPYPIGYIMKETFGSNIKKHREHSNMSRAELFVKSGVSIAQIERIEAGKSSPTLDTMVKLSSALKVNISDLIGPMEAA